MRRLAVLLTVVASAVAATPALAPAAGDGLEGARAKAVSWAVSQAGHRERGTTNCSARITRWERAMGLEAPPCQAWCGAFVHEAFRRAGVKLSARLIDPDRSYTDAVRGQRGLKAIPKGQVRPGDLLFFAFRRGLKASHIAIVRTKPSGGAVLTVEGNVAHAVRFARRGLKYPVLAARVTG
ncbi:NlpC/P60 family protein [Conexibacter sp. SYSU D00693]|uniref:NlpC/P60 family protein n=1 Tax=Conexibacter sp. SYSU D00693 TaxID=2812560 RepID=UPI00196AE868|nr:NlpC/P60 family protein [Conexibacter sp. SYSU D00693]